LLLHFSKRNALQSALIYSTGDTIASLLLHSFSFERMLGIMIIGGTLYALEIPNYFHWIHKRTEALNHFPAAVQRTIYALLYFNPVWIARHLAFVQIFSGQTFQLSWSLVWIGYHSFAMNIPVTVVINYLIQNKVSLHRRFLVSSVFSGVMAIYYAMSQVWFR
jgi:hypothetical protein